MKKPKRCVLRIQDLYANSERRNGSGCWYWLGAKTANGVPRIYTYDVDLQEKRPMSAAKAVWFISTGGNVGERIAYRKCFNRSCVNPDHIAIAKDRTELNRAMVSAGCSRTEAAIASKKRNIAEAHKANGITPTPPALVRQAFTMKGTGRAIAQALGLSEHVVSRIRLGQSHRDITHDLVSGK